MNFFIIITVALLNYNVAAFSPVKNVDLLVANIGKGAATAFSIATIALTSSASLAADRGASDAANTKIATGGASTLQSGRTIAVTRGVNLDRSDFGNQNLKGVAFQQSIVRDANFKGSNLVGASFFDATLDGSDFEGAGMVKSVFNFSICQLSNVVNDNAHIMKLVCQELFYSSF